MSAPSQGSPGWPGPSAPPTEPLQQGGPGPSAPSVAAFQREPGPSAPPTVALQGEPGSFSHAAARNLWGPELDLVPTRSFPELIHAVVSGRARWGIVPVENTLAGSVQGNLDLILRNDLQVVAETRVRVRLCLVAPPGSTLTDLRTAASHPVALQQCQAFFAAHPGLEPVAAWDTAGSIRDLMGGGAEYDAAIGSELAAEIYGGRILVREMEDDKENHTRFFAVSKRGWESVGEPESEGRPESGLTRKPESAGEAKSTAQPGPESTRGPESEWRPESEGEPESESLREPAVSREEESTPRNPKTSLAFVVAHEPGSLYRALGVFAHGGVDLMKLESRPIPGRPWEYRFFTDVRGSPGGKLGECLEELAGMTTEFRVMGCYPEWTEAD